MDQNPSDESTLYHRVGGAATIEKLVDAFYVEVMADPELAPFFAEVSIEKLRHMQREFFSSALGGPVTYTGRPIAYAHHGLGIKSNHVSRFVDHLMSTLDAYNLSDEDREGVISRINVYASEVLGGSGLDG
jgi:hemoglobin